MTIWMAVVDWDHHPDTGLPQQSYTVLMPNRPSAELRVLEFLRVASGADPAEATVVTHARTPTSTRAVVTLGGMQFDYRVTQHHGTLKDPGLAVQNQESGAP